MALTGYKLKKLSPPASASLAFGALTALEAAQATLPDRSFDLGDMAVYTLGLGLYLTGWHYFQRRKTLAAETEPPPAPPAVNGPT